MYMGMSRSHNGVVCFRACNFIDGLRLPRNLMLQLFIDNKSDFDFMYNLRGYS